MTVAVVTDSSCAIPKDLAARYNIRIVPLYLIWEGKEYADWVDIVPDEFYARLRETETLPTTSGVVPKEFQAVFEELRGKVDGVVAITLSPDTPSLAYWSAVMAKTLVAGLAIEVVDSRFTTTALGLVVTAAARAAAAGASLQDVMKVARSVIPKMHMFLNAGPISHFLRIKAASRMGHNDITTMKDGRLVQFESHLSKEEARRRLRELLYERARKDRPLHAAVFHADAVEAAEEFKRDIASQYQYTELWIGESSPVVAARVLPDSLGIAFYNE
jgi:DegV family protein with EDD domain